MELGFETIGNATLIAFDGRPVLVTDPWIAGEAYFGGWGLSHEIPPEQMAAIRSADHVWFSHGHPGHLNGDSLPLLRGRVILLPAHVGGRIRNELAGQGYGVRELPTAEWVQLSSRVRVMCLPDYNQDAVLLVAIGDALIVNANDSGALGWIQTITRLIRNFMKTTLHGKWPQSRLYPDFSPYVAKYADNGKARTGEELRAYFAEYRRMTGAFAFVRPPLHDSGDRGGPVAARRRHARLPLGAARVLGAEEQP